MVCLMRPSVTTLISAIAILLAILVCATPVVVQAARDIVPTQTFDYKSGGFRYYDDILGTHYPLYVKGRRYGDLGIWLGGRDDKPVGQMSGGWKRRFRIRKGVHQVTMSIDYSASLSLSNEHPPKRVDLKVRAAGKWYNLAHLSRNTAYGRGTISGHKTFQIGPLHPGVYYIELIATMNRKDGRGDIADVHYDNFRLTLH